MDLNELREILQILHEKDITEFELEEKGIKLRIRRPGLAAEGMAVPLAADRRGAPSAVALSAASSPAPAAARVAPAAAEEGLHVVKSPIVGTFFRAADPNSPAFVQAGDRVKSGQVLCIIEAMKLMNEIECEVAGEIVQIHPENGQPVQYGEPLFSIRP